MKPFLTCPSAPQRLHRNAIRSPHRQPHRRWIWAIYAALKPSLLDVRLVGLGVVDAAHVAVVAVLAGVRLDPGPVLAGLLGLVDVDALVALVLEEFLALLLRLALGAPGGRRRAGREPRDAERRRQRACRPSERAHVFPSASPPAAPSGAGPCAVNPRSPLKFPTGAGTC